VNLFIYLRPSMLLFVKVKPNQRFDKVEKSSDGWQIRLKAPAVDGKANEHLVEYLAAVLGLPKSKIILKKGLQAKYKCLEIFADDTQVLAKLESISGNSQ
jgi:uncharacterized protein YggU (UPF0235/DUF167 family)